MMRHGLDDNVASVSNYGGIFLVWTWLP